MHTVSDLMVILRYGPPLMTINTLSLTLKPSVLGFWRVKNQINALDLLFYKA